LDVTIELSDSERERYAAQIAGEVGIEGQLRLKRARAIVIGAGGAGSSAAAQLASCGVGYVAVVDGAIVALADLAGQAMYYTPDVGRSKADTLSGKLGLLNPDVQVESYPVALEAQNAGAIVEGHDVVLNCTHDAAVREALRAAGVATLQSAPGQVPGAALAADALRLLTRSPAEALT
jgi:molybdopterin-synthase adenylyltransferase